MRGFLLKYVVSGALGAVMVWLAFRHENWSDFGARLEQVKMGPFMGYVGLFAAAHAIRIARWGVLVRALGDIRWKDIVAVGSVGYMCIIVFPLRLGEFVRPVLIRGRGVTASGALATVVVERVIDGLLFVALFFVFISMLPETGNPAVDAVKITGYLAGAVFLTVLGVLIGAYTNREATLRLARRIGEPIHKGLTDKAVGLLEAFIEGLKVLPNRRRLVLFFGMTAFYWAAQGIGLKFMATAAGIPDLSYTGAFAILAVLVVGIMIPAGPGFTGTFELAVAAGFSLLILSPASLENVALFTILLHVVQLVVQVSFGAVFLLTGQVRLGQIMAAGVDEERPAT